MAEKSPGRFVISLEAPGSADPEVCGPKTANQAMLGHAGLPTPGGYCLVADAYRHQLGSLGVDDALDALATAEYRDARKLTNDIRLVLFKEPMVAEIEDEILAWRADLVAANPGRIVARSSALIEDREGTSFAGQFESFLGLENEEDFITSVRACWAALWSTRALRYMDSHDLTPTSTAMAVLVQPLVDAIASGGGMSKTADGGMSVTATWGLGEAIAQGEVVPDRYDLDADANLTETTAGRIDHSVSCIHHHTNPTPMAIDDDRSGRHCLNPEQVGELAGYMRQAEKLMGQAVEIEWAMDSAGIKMLQARPLNMEEAAVPDEFWDRHPGLRGQPGGIGWGTGRACVINCECELGRVGHGDILVTTVAGPSLSQILPHVAGVVAELGGSTSHLASLARERGTPMVLGVLDATKAIPEGAQVAVDGVGGVVRWVEG